MENDKRIYDMVPNIISGKDLDYLSDMFSWNYGAYKCTNSSIKSVSDNDIKSILKDSSDIFYNNMNKILFLLNAGGNNGQ